MRRSRSAAFLDDNDDKEEQKMDIAPRDLLQGSQSVPNFKN